MTRFGQLSLLPRLYSALSRPAREVWDWTRCKVRWHSWSCEGMDYHHRRSNR